MAVDQKRAPSDAFDLVISSGVAHHTPDPRRAVEECARVLAPGGRLYLRVYNRHSLYRWVYGTYGALLRALYARRATRFLGEWSGFRGYRWWRRRVFSRPDADERIVRDVASLKGEKVNYLSLMLVQNPKRQRGELRRGCRKRKAEAEQQNEPATA